MKLSLEGKSKARFAYNKRGKEDESLGRRSCQLAGWLAARKLEIYL